jgi:hypothetical protein
MGLKELSDVAYGRADEKTRQTVLDELKNPDSETSRLVRDVRNGVAELIEGGPRIDLKAVAPLEGAEGGDFIAFALRIKREGDLRRLDGLEEEVGKSDKGGGVADGPKEKDGLR